jgi:3'(2'), 5'-bisphosphate nucleotidase
MVDPLDGTKEFVKRNGEFTVNIALIHKQKSILGVIYVPVTKTLYFAAENVGCYKSTSNVTESGTDSYRYEGLEFASLEELIKSSDKLPLETTNKKFIVVASRSHLSEETEMFIDGLKTAHKEVEFISSGSSIKLCLVAEGSANVYPRFAPTMEWDTAAGQAICEIAGKKVIDYTTNQNLLYNKPNLLNNWFIVQ